MAHVRLADYSAYNPPSGARLMGVLKAYLDDSGSPPDPYCAAFALAGYVAAVEAWTAFETEWPKMLDRHRVPYLHMNEFGDPTSPLFQVTGSARDALLSDSIAVIRGSGLYSFGAVVRLHDLEEFNLGSGRTLQAKSLALFSCMIELYHKYRDQQIELKLGIGEKPYSCFATAQEYADSYKFPVGKALTFSPLAKDETLDKLLPMQAADFAVYEAFKTATKYDEWFSRKRNIKGDLEQFIDQRTWAVEQFGEWPAYRKSFASLIKDTPIEGIVWDYEFMCAHDKARGGVWSSVSS